MTLNGTLYQILQDEGAAITLQLCDSHPVYEGHFPGMPITPGVLTLGMIRECAERRTGRALRFSSIKSCRLAAMVRPGDVLKLTMDITREGDSLKVKASLTGAENEEDLRLQLDAEFL